MSSKPITCHVSDALVAASTNKGQIERTQEAADCAWLRSLLVRPLAYVACSPGCACLRFAK
eukprot:7384437-Prymnesium_polylepis.1